MIQHFIGQFTNLEQSEKQFTDRFRVAFMLFIRARHKSSEPWWEDEGVVERRVNVVNRPRSSPAKWTPIFHWR